MTDFESNYISKEKQANNKINYLNEIDGLLNRLKSLNQENMQDL